MSEHPQWLAVGATVEVTRAIGRSVSWRKTATVVKHTRTQVVVRYEHGAEERFRSRYGRYVMTPAYLDYTTVLNPPA